MLLLFCGSVPAGAAPRHVQIFADGVLGGRKILSGRSCLLYTSKTNRKNAGFTDEERAKFSHVLESGFIDTYRYFYPDQEGVYSWWSYRFKAREKNAGWRIDYFCVSESLKDRLVSASIHTEVTGSDHCPVELVIE